MSKNINSILIPNVTKTPAHKQVDHSNRLGKNSKSSEFNDLLKGEISDQQPLHGGLSFSTHASKRIEERKIDIDAKEYMKIREAMAKLKAKGGKTSLIVSDKAAYIIDIKNNKIVTAVDKNSIAENVFTKIDSTAFVN